MIEDHFQRRLADLVFSVKEVISTLELEMRETEDAHEDWEGSEPHEEELHDDWQNDEPAIVDNQTQIDALQRAVNLIEKAIDEIDEVLE